MAENAILLSLIAFLPALGALVVACLPNNRDDLIKWVSLLFTLLVFLPLLPVALSYDVSSGAMQHAFSYSWIPTFNINYAMGLDGFSLPLVVLTAVVSALAMGASWPISKHVKAYCILFLTLECAMLGVFMALDFFLFYVFWEVMLLPMYFLIGVWGGPRRLYASVKFFLYTLVGGVLMLIALLILYFNSDLREVAKNSDFFPTMSGKVKWSELNIISPEIEQRLGKREVYENEFSDFVLAMYRSPQADNSKPLWVTLEPSAEAGENSASYDNKSNTVTVSVSPQHNTAGEIIDTINGDQAVSKVLLAGLARDTKASDVLPSKGSLSWELEALDGSMIHSFNLLALAAMGQKTAVFTRTIQIAAFVLLFIGFIIKLPSVPVHTWLPDAHVEAPTPISMILAGVLLKMGGYGIIRICYPICPWGGYDLALVVCLIGVVSMVYGAFAALAQKDFKRLVAYSSVSHMGYVLLGMGVWSVTAGSAGGVGAYDASAWNMGVSGAMFQMIGHGISSAGMFFMVGVVYERVHHRNLNEFGGLFGKMPVYTALSIGIFFAGLGLPGLCGFIGEFFVVLSVWNYSAWLAVIAASVVILTAGYILWAIQRVYLGPEYKGPHPEALTRSTPREWLIGGVLFVLAILLGVFPFQTVLNYMDETVTNQVKSLSDWTRDVADKDGQTKQQQTVEKNQQDEQANLGVPAKGEFSRKEDGLKRNAHADSLAAGVAEQDSQSRRGPPSGE